MRDDLATEEALFTIASDEIHTHAAEMLQALAHTDIVKRAAGHEVHLRVVRRSKRKPLSPLPDGTCCPCRHQPPAVLHRRRSCPFFLFLSLYTPLHLPPKSLILNSFSSSPTSGWTSGPTVGRNGGRRSGP